MYMRHFNYDIILLLSCYLIFLLSISIYFTQSLDSINIVDGILNNCPNISI